MKARLRFGSLTVVLSAALVACGDDTAMGGSAPGGGNTGGTPSTGGSNEGGGGASVEGGGGASVEGDGGASVEGGGGAGGGPMSTPPTCGALENVPSDPGPHIAQIEALADDEWLALGPPAADPQFGVALGRSWGGRALVLAPDLRGAFYTGEGVHAYVKPDGHGMDDVFFYDINAHAWIAVHSGNEIATFNQRVMDGDLSIDENGQLQDATGNPVPLHVLIHAWDFLTYDTASQRFVFIAGDGMGDYFMPGLEMVQEGLDMLMAQREGITVPPMSPWSYSTADCAWERYPIETPTPDVGGFGAFIYATATDQYVYAGANGAATFDRTSNAWAVAEDSGPRPTGYDHGVAYDPTRNRLYMGSGDGTTSPGVFIYDIATSAWTKPESDGTAPATFRTNEASIFYDSVNDVVTVFQYAERMHYTYDPEADSWTSRALPDEMLDSVSYPSFNAFYDPALDAYFVYVASDSGDNGTMWAYRYL